MKSIFPYLVLILAVICGTASNSFANSANGFTKLVPSIYSIITIILCMYLLSQVMKFLPVGITYATFAGLCIIGTSFVGIIKFSQIPSISTIIGLMLIVSGVLIVNLLGKNQIWTNLKIYILFTLLIQNVWAVLPAKNRLWFLRYP